MTKPKNAKGKPYRMKIILLIIAIPVILEIIALLWLASTVGSYRSFWQRKAQEPGEITYLALGDSAAQGIGATSPMRGYVGLIAKRLETKTGKSVKVINLSATGATTRDCLNGQIPKIDGITADVVTIECGANDVRRMNMPQFKKGFTELLSKLPDGTYVANMPLFNSRPSSTQPAKDQTTFIETEIKKFPKLKLVDLQKQTTEHQSIFGFAPDLFHPNNLSYKNWAQAFWNEIEKDI